MGQRTDLHFIVKIYVSTEGVGDPYDVAGVVACRIYRTAPEWDVHSTVFCTVGVPGHVDLDMFRCAIACLSAE